MKDVRREVVRKTERSAAGVMCDAGAEGAESGAEGC